MELDLEPLPEPRRGARIWHCDRCAQAIAPPGFEGVITPDGKRFCNGCAALLLFNTRKTAPPPKPPAVPAAPDAQRILVVLLACASVIGVALMVVLSRLHRNSDSTQKTLAQQMKETTAAAGSSTKQEAPAVSPSIAASVAAPAAPPQEAPAPLQEAPAVPPIVQAPPEQAAPPAPPAQTVPNVPAWTPPLQNAPRWDGVAPPDGNRSGTAGAPRADESRIEFPFIDSKELEQWRQVEPGWSCENGVLTCAKPQLNQRIEFSQPLTGGVIVTYEGITGSDMGISFVDVANPSAVDRVVAGGMDGKQAGLMCTGKSKPKLVPLLIADGKTHSVEVSRTDESLSLKVDGKLVADLPAGQTYHASLYKLRLHLWEKPGSFSRLAIQKLRAQAKEE